MRCLVTGASGFVGRAMVARLAAEGADVVAGLRRAADLPGRVAVVGDIDGNTDWSAALAGVDAVVHLAARVHVMRERARDPLAEFRRVNVAGSVNLARQAAAAGVRRFVYVSTVKVLGGEGRFDDASPAAPADSYSISKRVAEERLFAVGEESGMEIVVLRPPLVYGPGVGGNFLRLMRLVATGAPMPFGLVENRRSMICLENLVDALYLCLAAERIAGRAWLVSDGEPVSTAELFRRLARAMGRPCRLLPAPPSLLRMTAKLAGLGREMARLTGSLVVDDSGFRAATGWRPPVSFDDGLRRTVDWFLTTL